MSPYADEIKASLDRFSAAWKANDGAAVAGLYTEDGSLINPFGQRADGRAAVAAMYTEYFGGMLNGTSTTFKLANVRAVGQDHAFVDSEQTITAADGSTLFALHNAALMRRDGGAWRIVDARPFTFAQPGG
jgi:uncharacterized protein (TIGR02246 family)